MPIITICRTCLFKFFKSKVLSISLCAEKSKKKRQMKSSARILAYLTRMKMNIWTMRMMAQTQIRKSQTRMTIYRPLSNNSPTLSLLIRRRETRLQMMWTLRSLIQMICQNLIRKTPNKISQIVTRTLTTQNTPMITRVRLISQISLSSSLSSRQLLSILNTISDEGHTLPVFM